MPTCTLVYTYNFIFMYERILSEFQHGMKFMARNVFIKYDTLFYKPFRLCDTIM